MFGLFKKKKEEPKSPEPQEQNQEYKAFAAEFPGEETDILAVTGGSAMDTAQSGEGGLWHISMGLTAWKDEYVQELQQGQATLEALVDDNLLEHLRARLPRDFLIRVTVRPDGDGTRFLMTDLPKPAFDPELKALLEEQKKPVTLEADGLGVFTLSRAMNWFQTELDWPGAPVQLVFDREEDQEQSLTAARTLWENREDWDRRVREFAAGQLLEQVNEALQEEGPVTGEQLADALEAESVQVTGDGGVTFWLRSEELLWGRAVRVSGSLTDGPVQAELED